jgi:hypothetical protein
LSVLMNSSTWTAPPSKQATKATTMTTTTTTTSTTTTPLPTLFEDSDLDFGDFPELPDFNDESVVETKVVVTKQESGFESWSTYFNNFTTEKKIIIATTVPSLIVVIGLVVLVLGCCFYKCNWCRQNVEKKEKDLEVILI